VIPIRKPEHAEHEWRLPLLRCPLSGSAFVAVVAVQYEAFTIQGTTDSFTNAGDSGRKLTREFCPRCGSMLAIEAEGFPA
jgi:hypothetical protein